MKTAANPAQAAATGTTPEERFALPVALLLWSILGAGLIILGIWLLVVWLGSWGEEVMASGIWGIGLATGMAAGGTLVMTPWKKRPAADWMTMWLGGTVFRVLGTPLVAYLLYSAASPPLAMKPFGLAVALAYMCTLFVEAAVLSHHLRLRCPAPGAG